MNTLIKNLADSCRFKIGETYTNRKGEKCTIKDIRLTFSASGEWIATKYVVAHTFMGQEIINYDVVDTTIARALMCKHGYIGKECKLEGVAQ